MSPLHDTYPVIKRAGRYFITSPWGEIGPFTAEADATAALIAFTNDVAHQAVLYVEDMRRLAAREGVQLPPFRSGASLVARPQPVDAKKVSEAIALLESVGMKVAAPVRNNIAVDQPKPRKREKLRSDFGKPAPRRRAVLDKETAAVVRDLYGEAIANGSTPREAIWAIAGTIGCGTRSIMRILVNRSYTDPNHTVIFKPEANLTP